MDASFWAASAAVVSSVASLIFAILAVKREGARDRSMIAPLAVLNKNAQPHILIFSGEDEEPAVKSPSKDEEPISVGLMNIGPATASRVECLFFGPNRELEGRISALSMARGEFKKTELESTGLSSVTCYCWWFDGRGVLHREKQQLVVNKEAPAAGTFFVPWLQGVNGLVPWLQGVDSEETPKDLQERLDQVKWDTPQRRRHWSRRL